MPAQSPFVTAFGRHRINGATNIACANRRGPPLNDLGPGVTDPPDPSLINLPVPPEIAGQEALRR
jgi:hypothetical protein